MGKNSLAFEKKTDEVKLNMSPLIDMIFILLIFFLVTTTFVKESGVEVNRPVGSDKPSTQEKANIQINVTRDGMVYVDGQAIDIRSVQSRMERFKYENPDGNVIITSDSKSRFGVSIEVLDQVRLADIKNVVVTPAAE
ncbi:MAG: biopolymer transporter ExbD [Desulfobacteraceae bacterium]|jgi:biopolymer transport protein ExbD